MPKVLFTKYYSETIIQQNLSDFFEVEAVDFIQTEFVSIEKIQTQLHSGIQSFIVSSARAAKHISTFNLKGEFYCVGQNATKILEGANKKVRLTLKDGKGLVKAIEEETLNLQLSTSNFLYFCSNIRRDEIPNGLKELGHNVTEIICYNTTSKEVKIQNNFNAYVFFSPSGVKSFAEQYKIPEKATIFAIGETTAKSVFNELEQQAIIPEEPNLASLIQKIKTYFNAKE